MNGPNSHRLFIAITVSEAILAKLSQVQEELRRLLPTLSASWTKPEAMHLTVRFLGSVAVEQLAELQQQLQRGVSGCGNLQLVCEGLGCFPDDRRPRVLWAAVHDRNKRLPLIAERVDKAVFMFAEKPAEARFQGHITLARPKTMERADSEALSEYVRHAKQHCFGTWQAGNLKLIRSELLPHGSRYTTLKVIDLAGGEPA